MIRIGEPVDTTQKVGVPTLVEPRKKGRKTKNDVKKDSILILNKMAKQGNKSAIKLLKHYHYILSVKTASEQQIIDFILRSKKTKG